MQKAVISTATLARLLDLKRGSINTALYRHGHLYGLRPIKLQNGRLVWPANAVEIITAGSRAG